MHDSQYSPTPQPDWYKTPGGIAFLGVLGVITILGIVFLSFVGYYTYQIRAGNGADIARQLQEAQTSFSTSDALATAATPAQDPLAFVRPFNPKAGNPDSPITIMVFIDFECPFCQQSYPIFQQVAEQYQGAVRIVFKHFPLSSIHPLATQAALAASCAHEQDTFWPYYEQLFDTTALSREDLMRHAADLHLNQQSFDTCLSSGRYRQQVEQDIQDGIALGVRGTPTYFIDDTRLEGVVPLEAWNAELIAAIQQQ